MFDEEKDLGKWKEEIEKKEIIDSQLENAILRGIERAKDYKTKKKRHIMKRNVWTTIAVAILLLTFITSIRVSPVFANAIASIPGMSGIVELIQDNKGLQLAIENEHFQAIGTSGEVESMKVTLDGIITDETSMVLFSTIEKKKNSPNRFISGYRILNQKGEDLSNGGSVSVSWHHLPEIHSSNIVEVDFKKELPTEAMILEVKLSESLGEREKETIQIPFEVDLKPIKKEHYVINETAVVKGQKIHIRSVTIGSLKTAVEVEFDEKNSKKIFDFEDLRLEDENGEIWTSITNGVTGRGTENPNVHIFYLQSNYFKETENLNLKFNKLMAMDKEQAELVINTATGEIVKQPNDERFSNLTVNGKYINIQLEGVKGYHHDPFSTFYDHNGKELHSQSGTFSPRDDEHISIGIEMRDEVFTNPLRFPLHAYPSYIKGNVTIKIK